MLHVLFVDQPLYSSCSLRTNNQETASGIHSAHSHLEDTPNCPSPTLSTYSIDASCYVTPVACKGPAAMLCFSPEPILPCLQSISATPGFSAFTPVVQEPLCALPDKANSNKSPQKVYHAFSYVNFQFSILYLNTSDTLVKCSVLFCSVL